jgi:tetratricopeptide (TPR) repeat protein
MSTPPRSAPYAPGLPPLTGTGLSERDTAALGRARAAWQRGDRDAALRLFARAALDDPLNVTALVDAGRAFAFGGLPGRAAEHVERLRRLAPDHPRALHLAGETYRMAGLFREATDCFARVCATADSPAAQIELATLYERQHRLDEAHDLITRALATLPGYLPAWLVKARVQRRRGDTAGAEATLRDLIARAGGDPPVQAEAWAELGQLYDAAGGYDDAWDAVGRSKQLLRAREAPERHAAEHVLKRFARLVDALTPRHFARWHDFTPARSHRLALLTGFPRSGTTLLEQVLDSHPGLVSSEETDVLSARVMPALGAGRPEDYDVAALLDHLTPEVINRQRAAYVRAIEALLREPVGGRVHLDKNPALNLMIPVVLRLFPETRLLIALRDPRDVVLSCYLRFLPLNPVSVSFLTPERTAQRYALDMLAWLKFRDLVRTSWAEFRYEDTVADLPAAARKALDLLGLPWDDRVLAYRERLREKPVLSPTYEAVTRPVYTTAVGRWRNYAKYLGPVLPMLEPYAREFGYE